jgi:hypothetical protein
MNQGSVKVLLLGESEIGSSFLLRRLEQRGCRCWYARSAEEGFALFDRHGFHLILSTSPLRKANPLLALLGESNCTVYYCYPVEDSCWWLPLMHHGQKCLGAPALRPSEFVDALDQMVREIQLEGMAAAKEPQEV